MWWAGARAAIPSPRTMRVSAAEARRRAMVCVNRSRMPTVSLRGSCTKATTMTPNARPWVRISFNRLAASLTTSLEAYAVRTASSSIISTCTGSPGVGVKVRDRPRMTLCRSTMTRCRSRSSLTASASFMATWENIGDPTATSTPPLRSTPHRRAMPAWAAGARFPAMPQKIDPLPEPERPTTRVCRAARFSRQGDPSAVRPRVTARVSMASGMVGRVGTCSSSRMVSDSSSHPAPSLRVSTASAPIEVAMASAAFVRSSTVCPTRARTWNVSVFPSARTRRRRGMTRASSVVRVRPQRSAIFGHCLRR
ncbi:hypothetical protein ISCU110981_09135 [Isoptericola cucumis]